jgi:hypothetical protein
MNHPVYLAIYHFPGYVSQETNMKTPFFDDYYKIWHISYTFSLVKI